jgi:hypothetical protein
MPHRLPDLQEEAFRLSPLGEAKVADRLADGVLVRHPRHPDVRLFFDRATGLPAKAEVRVKVTGQSTKGQAFAYFYEEYRDVAGLRHPMKVVVKALATKFTLELEAVKPRPKLDDRLFEKP